MLSQFLHNLPVPSLAHWNSGWFSPLRVVNISRCAALSGIFSARLPVPEIAFSCRKSEFYNGHAMFTSLMSEAPFCLSSCLSACHWEWGNSATAVLSESWSSSRARGAVRDQVLRQVLRQLQLQIFWGRLFRQSGFLSRSSARDRGTVLKKARCSAPCPASCSAKALCIILLQAAGLSSLWCPVTTSHISSNVPMILHAFPMLACTWLQHFTHTKRPATVILYSCRAWIQVWIPRLSPEWIMKSRL